MLPSAGMNVAPHFCVKPARGTASSAPIARRTSLVDARSDSPTWKRGNRSRSRSTTLRPARARNAAAADPAGPPPITSTSPSNACFDTAPSVDRVAKSVWGGPYPIQDRIQDRIQDQIQDQILDRILDRIGGRPASPPYVRERSDA